MTAAPDSARDRAARAVGSVIRRARKTQGWTSEEAAERAGIAQKTWARVENGEDVRSASLTSIAQLFQLPNDALRVALARDAGHLQLAKQLGVDSPADDQAERVFRELRDLLVENTNLRAEVARLRDMDAVAAELAKPEPAYCSCQFGLPRCASCTRNSQASPDPAEATAVLRELVAWWDSPTLRDSDWSHFLVIQARARALAEGEAGR